VASPVAGHASWVTGKGWTLRTGRPGETVVVTLAGVVVQKHRETWEIVEETVFGASAEARQ
jgi:hypothetical protein